MQLFRAISNQLAHRCGFDNLSGLLWVLDGYRRFINNRPGFSAQQRRYFTSLCSFQLRADMLIRCQAAVAPTDTRPTTLMSHLVRHCHIHRYWIPASATGVAPSGPDSGRCDMPVPLGTTCTLPRLCCVVCYYCYYFSSLSWMRRARPGHRTYGSTVLQHRYVHSLVGNRPTIRVRTKRTLRD